MKNYLLFILIPIVLIFLFFYFENDEDEEVPIIYPINEKIKKKIKVDSKFVQSYNGKAAYENLVRENNKKKKNIKLSPKPEKPIEIKPKKETVDVFGALNKTILEKPDEESVFDNLENENKTQKLNIKTVKSEKIVNFSPLKKIEKDRFYVQLAYSKSQELVNQQMTIINQNNKFLSKQKGGIYKSKRQNGILYEYLVGPLDEFKIAKLICTKVKLESNKCIVVKK